MIEEKIIKKNRLNAMLQELSKEYSIYIPAGENGDFRFCELRDTNDELVFWDYRNTRISPKEILFPHSEILYEFSRDESHQFSISQNNDDQRKMKNVILGIRPCDARAIGFLDRVFIGEPNERFVDPYYLKRRIHTIIISLACNRPQISCFCTSLNGRPDGEEGADIIAFDIGEEILLKTVTEKGKEFIKESSKWLGNAKKSDIDKKNKIFKESAKRINSRVSVEKVKEKLDDSFEADFWNEIHRKCLGCGICTFLCSTCHCFDITDETSADRGKRIKCWDSCMYPLFTLHASGHNPRPNYKERMRQRIMHKFNYCPENFKELFCVGCGRCIRNCPVNLDIREVINQVSQLK